MMWSGLVGGGVAGAIECAVCQPFDMVTTRMKEHRTHEDPPQVKTRHQIYIGRNPSTFESLRLLYLEGGVARYYRGVLPELAGMVPKNAAMYGSYDGTYPPVSARTLIKKPLGANRMLLKHSSMSAPAAAFVAGGLSGPFEAITVQPFQVVKVRMQAKEHVGRYRSSFDCFRQLFIHEGLFIFRTGFAATCYRNVVWNSVYFGSMALVRTRKETITNSFLDYAFDPLAGFACGFFATIFNAPFDVVKSRQQTTTAYPPGAIATLRRVAREEGLRACWQGFTPKAIRMGLAGLVGLTTFDLVQLLSGTPKPHR